MQTTEKNSKQPKPTATELGAITDLVLAMHYDYGNGLRQFQEAIHYAVGHLALASDDDDDIVLEDKRSNVLYLLDLTNRLRKIESILPIKSVSYE